MQRRALLKMTAASAASGIAFYHWAVSAAAQASPGQQSYQAVDLAGWEVVVGDGLYVAPGQAPITVDDIATIHAGTHSELQANVQRRGIMVHNITFNRKIDPTALTYTHLCDYEFRLTFVPATNNWNLNAQTLEVSFAIWDGGNSRLDYTVALQWVLNPWSSNFGKVRCWSPINGGSWQTVGYLAPDTSWHKVSLAYDHEVQATAVLIDNQQYASTVVPTPKPSTWGTETAARLAAEIISLYPGAKSKGPLHLAQFRNWHWTWIPNSETA
jgi:hypothetical protein